MVDIDFSVDALKALNQSVEAVMVAADEAVSLAKTHVLDIVQKTAAADPRWIGVADYIDTWDENDRFWVGVREPAFISEAFAAEYGTDEFPPAPIMRNLDDAMRQAATRASMHMTGRLPGNFRV